MALATELEQYISHRRNVSDALVITPTAGLAYSEVMSQEVRVKRTAEGELLLEEGASAHDFTQKLKVDMEALHGTRASLRTVTKSKVFLIRDLEELATGRYPSIRGGNQRSMEREDCCNSISSQSCGIHDQTWHAEGRVVSMPDQGTEACLSL